MDTSKVAKVGPPRIRITPNDVNENANASKAEEAIAGSRTGSVTWKRVRTRPAPKHRRALLDLGVDVGPKGGDDPYHDGVVVEGVGNENHR